MSPMLRRNAASPRAQHTCSKKVDVEHVGLVAMSFLSQEEELQRESAVGPLFAETLRAFIKSQIE